MLYVATTDNWAFSVTVTVGAFAAQTYTNSAVNNNARLADSAFLLWLNDPARSWTGVVLWTSSNARSVTAGIRFTYTCGNIFTLTGGAATCLGLAAGAYAGAATSATDAAGTWWPSVRIAVSSYARGLDAGDASGTGSTRPGSVGAALYRPTVEAIGNGSDAARLSAVLAKSSSPRIAQIYEVKSSAWRTVSLGAVQRTRNGVDYRFSLETVGA